MTNGTQQQPTTNPSPAAVRPTALATRTDGTALDLRADRLAFEPATLSEAMQLAEIFLRSNLLPRAITTKEQAFTIIATGREYGLSAMQSLRMIHVIEGKPSFSADLIVGLVKRDDCCEYFDLIESTPLVARYETKRKGSSKPTPLAFTLEQAHKAKLTTKDNWSKYPDAMLRARCSAALARAVYPDIVGNLYTEDEVERTERDVTPPAEPPKRSRRAQAEPPAAPVAAVPPGLDVGAAPRQPTSGTTPFDPETGAFTLGAVAADAIKAIDAIAGDDVNKQIKELVPQLERQVRENAISGEELATVYAALLSKCRTNTDANDTAAIIIKLAADNVLHPDDVTALRAIYGARPKTLRDPPKPAAQAGA